MPCLNPLTAWRYEGKIVFNAPPNHLGNKPFNLPCGKCIQCRLNSARSWALRCQLEAKQHTDNCFITLTFSPEELIKRKNPFTVDVEDFQLFMKKFRNNFNKEIRFFHCGEYGEKSRRPHYHALIFGHDFRIPSPTNIVQKFGKGKYPLFNSSELTSLWGRGHTTVGELNYDTASYTARYVTKKVKGDVSNIYIDPETNKVHKVNDVYCTMSRNKGIGYQSYLDAFLPNGKHDWYKNDYIVNSHGIKMKPPRFFDKHYEKDNPEHFKKIKKQRQLNCQSTGTNGFDKEIQRLRYIEVVQLLKLKETLREFA